MQFSINEIALHLDGAAASTEMCPALNDRAPGLAVCSLPAGGHRTHQLRCEDTGELLGRWTDADKTFREPIAEIRRDIDSSHAA